jgi:hypothetical protein
MERRRRWSPPPPSLEVAMAGEACVIRMRWGEEEVEGRGDGGHRMGLGESRCQSKDLFATSLASRVASGAGVLREWAAGVEGFSALLVFAIFFSLLNLFLFYNKYFCVLSCILQIPLCCLYNIIKEYSL